MSQRRLNGQLNRLTSLRQTKKDNWIAKIDKLKADHEQNKPTDNKENLRKEYLGRLALTKQTTAHLNQVLAEPDGNSER